MINLVNILYYTVILNTNITFIYNIFEILIFLCENGFSFIINRCFSFLTYFVSIKVIISVFRLIFRKGNFLFYLDEYFILFDCSVIFQAKKRLFWSIFLILSNWSSRNSFGPPPLNYPRVSKGSWRIHFQLCSQRKK